MTSERATSEARQSGLGSEPHQTRQGDRKKREIQILIIPLDRSGDLRAALRNEHEAEEAAALQQEDTS